MEAETLDENEVAGTILSKGGNHLNGEKSSLESLSRSKAPKGLKSFSHELGPKGGIQPAHNRAHSYSDLKVSLISFIKEELDSYLVFHFHMQ